MTTNSEERTQASSACSEATKVRKHLKFEVLADMFPQLFGDQWKPMKIGILEEISIEIGDRYSYQAIRATLASHARNERYLRGVAAGGLRFNLKGESSGVVSEKDQAYAKVQLLRIEKYRQESTERKQFLKEFERSGMSLITFAKYKGLEMPKVHSDYNKAIYERGKRRATRSTVVTAYVRSGLSLEEFARRNRWKVSTLKKMVAQQANSDQKESHT